MIWSAKTYGIKAVNPGGVAAWKWGKNANQLHEPIEGYKTITAGADHRRSSRRSCDELGLPHPMHLHQNNLGVPGNVTSTVETMKILEGHRTHLAHLQFHAYGGHDWGSMKSEAAAVAEEFNKHKNLTCDVGAILFGDAVTITADGPWQHLLYELTGRKWGNLDVENETGCGIVPYVYSDHHLVNSVQWAVGLELLLLIDRPVARLPDHRPSERRRLLALSGDRPAADGRRVPQGRGAQAAGRSAEAHHAGGARSRIHVLRRRHPHLRRSGARAGSDAEGTARASAPTATSRSIPRSRTRTASCSPIRATCSRAARSWSRKDRCARLREGREFICRPKFDPTIEDYIRPQFYEALHDVVRELPDRHRADASARHCRVRTAARHGPPAAAAARARTCARAQMITLTLKEPVDLVPLEAEVHLSGHDGDAQERRDSGAAGLSGQEAHAARRLLRRSRAKRATRSRFVAN